jgi:osmotically-inducible protein OsmY
MSNTIRNIIFISTVFIVIGCQYIPGNGLLNFGAQDSQITIDVHQKLKNNIELEPFVFHVETSEGVVYLSGYVKTIRQSDTAEMIAKQVSGVQAVENNIIVRK